MNVGNPQHKNTVLGLVLCHHDRGMLAKSADIWLSSQHVADMLTNFPAKASTMQLGAVITQGNRPIAFFSRKLSKMQSKYSVTKIKHLAIVETLKEFQGMLWGQVIKVYTDHKNLTCDALGLTSDRVYHWQLLLEEFDPEIVYIKGIHHSVTDAIS